MKPTEIKSSILNFFNDQIDIVDYGHGQLVYLPLQYSDDDSISLFVEEFGGGYRISDQGSTALRLTMSDINLDTPRNRSAWDSSLGRLLESPASAERDEIALWCAREDLGQGIASLAQGCARVDQIRLLAAPRKKMTFSERVTDRVMRTVNTLDSVTVKFKSRIPLTSGRQRPVTASVFPDGHPTNPTIIQAIGGQTNEQREDQLERCFHLFSFAEVPERSRIAVAIGQKDLWDRAMLEEIGSVSEVVFFDDNHDLELSLQRHLSQGQLT